MPTPTPRTKRKTLSPYAHLFIPIAFILGLGCGFLIWGDITPSTARAGSEEVRRVEVSIDDEPSLGPEDAPITIVEFSDYQCPYCESWHQQTFNQLLEKYPNQIRFVYRDLPLPMHPEAIPAAEAANCAAEQASYWAFHDALFSGRYELNRKAYEQIAADMGLNKTAFLACLDDHRYQAEVESDGQDAARLGMNGTPSFVINGRILVGARPISDFAAIIDEELAGRKK